LNAEDVPTNWLHVVKQILQHFTKHPAAKDTSQGMLQWWLKEGNVPGGRAELEQILETLVNIGWLVETRISSSPKIYGLNQNRTSDIEKFLNGLPK